MNEEELLEVRQIMASYFRQRREELNISHNALAEKTGLGIATIKRFENGMFWPGMKQYILICEALNLVPAAIPFSASGDFIEKMRRHWLINKE